MVTSIQCVKVFVASPGGLGEERRAFREALQSYNETDAFARGVIFRPVGWEDTLGGVGRPQTIINQDIEDCDCFILILWDRWGTSPDARPGPFSSATEEELAVAMRCLQDSTLSMQKVIIFFKAVDTKQMSDPGPQLAKVLEFRKKLETDKEHFFHTFDGAGRFVDLLRGHLASWLRGIELNRSLAPPPTTAPHIAKTPTPSVSRAITAPSGRVSTTTLAQKLASEGKLTEAEIEYSRVTVGERDAYAIVEYAVFLKTLGRLDQAKVLLERAKGLAAEQDDAVTRAEAIRWLGIIALIRGELDSAEGLLREALTLFESIRSGNGIAALLEDLGNLLRRKGNAVEARGLLRRALILYQDAGIQPGVANVSASLGVLELALGDLAEGERLMKSALEIHSAEHREASVAADYGNLGLALRAKGELLGAKDMHIRALEIFNRLGAQEGIADATGNLATIEQELGHLKEAESLYKQSLEIEMALGRQSGIASDRMNLGGVYFATGDNDGAEREIVAALQINERLGALREAAMCYSNLGLVEGKRGKRDLAVQYYSKSLEINERIGIRAGIAGDACKLGALALEEGKLEEARSYYERALHLEEEDGRLPGKALALGGLAAIALSEGDTARAVALNTAGLELASRLKSVFLVKKFTDQLNKLSAVRTSGAGDAPAQPENE